MIKLTNIHKQFKDQTILHGLDLVLESNSIHVLMGANGSGKSTLARILAKLDSHFSGDIEGLHDQKVMLMQQEFVIWPELSVLKNMSLAANKQACIYWIEKTELSSYMKKKAGLLSHGQKQRLSVARSLAFQPTFLIVDEAFSYLDPIQSTEAKKWIKESLGDPSNPLEYVLIVTQSSKEAFELAHQLSVLDNGCIIQTGLPKEIYEQPRRLHAAQLTGLTNIVNSKSWEKVKHFFSYEEIPRLLEKQLLSFRPEDIVAKHLSNHSEKSGFCVNDSHFTPYGTLYSLTSSHGVIVTTLSQEVLDLDTLYNFRFTTQPHVF